MDPDATMQAIIKALQDQDREALEEAASHLAIWLHVGGLMPRPIIDFARFRKPAH
jgi:hypothetical protein